jgi:glyoxylase-like metal-dependent hydrolase (beta-lactamase superfamily II)
MELVKIAGPAHYLPGRVNIGVLIGEGQAAFIDTGLDEGAARKAVQAVEQAHLRLAAVINTHAHADHCGGNAFVRLERYPIQYCYDALAHRATLERLAGLRRDWYVGAHFPPTQDLGPLLDANRANLDRTAGAVLDALRPAASTEEIVRTVADVLGVPPMDPAACLLNAAAIKAHLSAHVREGRLTFEIQDQRPVWRRMA